MHWPACPALIRADCKEGGNAEATGIRGIVLMLECVAGAATAAAIAGPGLKELCEKIWPGETLLLCGHRNRHATLS